MSEKTIGIKIGGDMLAKESLSLNEQRIVVQAITDLVDMFNDKSGKCLDIEDSILSDMAKRIDHEEVFGFDIKMPVSRLDDGIENIVYFKKDESKEGEYLCTVSLINTGILLSKTEYPYEIIQDLFHEAVRRYRPAIADEASYTLYFRPENAKAMYNDLPRLVGRYRLFAKERNRQLTIAYLEEQIDRLQMA